MTLTRAGLLAVAALILATLPFWGDASLQNIMTKVLISGLFAMSFNLLWGQAGLLSFGQAAYFGIGSFAAIYAMNVGGDGSVIPLPFVPVAGGVAALLLGLIAGWVSSKRSGIYFALITFAFAELVAAIAYQWDGVFGGESGVRARREDWWVLSFQSSESVYAFVFIWFCLALAALWFIRQSPFGQVMQGVRDREDRLAFLGYDTHKIKTATFAIAASFSGLAGALLAISNEAANFSLFSSHESTAVVLNTVVGGSGVFLGPVVGAAFTTLFGYYAGVHTTNWSLYLGLIFVAVVLFAPQGVTGVFMENVRSRKLDFKTLPNLLVRTIAVLAFALSTYVLVEIVGTLSTANYQVARTIARGGWPPVEVLGIEWIPFSPATIGAIAVGYGVFALLSGYWLPSLTRNLERARSYGASFLSQGLSR
jgi:branched-chain amino acid transport system permease protein